MVAGTDPVIYKKNGGFLTQDKRGGGNFMSPFKCIDHQKNGRVGGCSWVTTYRIIDTTYQHRPNATHLHMIARLDIPYI